MTSVKDLQATIERIRSGVMLAREVLILVHHRSPLVRVNALESLIEQSKCNEVILKELVSSVTDPVNSVRLMGDITVAHVALGFLFRVGTSHALSIANKIVKDWQGDDRIDLLTYLDSLGIKIE